MTFMAVSTEQEVTFFFTVASVYFMYLHNKVVPSCESIPPQSRLCLPGKEQGGERACGVVREQGRGAGRAAVGRDARARAGPRRGAGGGEGLRREPERCEGAGGLAGRHPHALPAHHPP